MSNYCYQPIDLTKMNHTQLAQLSANPFACFMLINNPEYIQWEMVPYNLNNYHIYSAYPNMISWVALKLNPQLIHLVQSDITQINWKT